MEHVRVKIERDEQSLMHNKQMIENSHNEMEKMKGFQDYFNKYGSAGAAGSMADWGRLDNYGKHIWQDQEGNIWQDKSSSYDMYRRSVGLDPASGMWNTPASVSGASETGLVAGSASGKSGISMEKLVEQIQIMNDLKIDHEFFKDYIGGSEFDKLTDNTTKKEK